MRDLDSLDVQGKRVLVRVDFNVPLKDRSDGSVGVADDTRIGAALLTLAQLRSRGARLVVASHLGRPGGHRDERLSMRPVADRLRELSGAPVALAPAVVGEPVRALADALREGDTLMLENVRFEPGETKNDPELARALAELADVYVNDAFSASHRAHASTEGVAHLLPSAAGPLLQREVLTLRKLLKQPRRPFLAILGGAKVADKIGVIDRLLELADAILIGGAMCFPFLHAQGHAVGASLCDAEDAGHADRLLAQAALPGRARLELPRDLVIARQLASEGERRVLDGVEVPNGWMGLDIGPATAAAYAAEVARAGSVFWNGPMGAFELEPYAQGTRRVAEAVAHAPGVTVVGGGDSAAALVRFGLEHAVDHLSMGGGATLALVEGQALPGLRVLEGAGVAS